MRLGQGSRGLTILTYHGFGPERAATVTDPSRFAETLSALHEAGWRGVCLNEWVAQGCPDEPMGYALAFDDGLRSILSVAEIVARLGVPATVFLVSGRVGSDSDWPGTRGRFPVEPLLTWSEITELAGLGFRFGAHGATHERFDRMQTDRLEREMRQSRETIESRTGRACSLLAYPYGLTSARIRRSARSLFSAAFGTSLGKAHQEEDRHELSRLDAYYLRSDRVLNALTAGRADVWIRWRRTLRAIRRASGTAPTARAWRPSA